MRPRYYLHMYDDNMSGLYGHRSSELINRYPVMGKIVRPSKEAQQAAGRRSVSMRLGKSFIEKLEGGR